MMKDVVLQVDGNGMFAFLLQKSGDCQTEIMTTNDKSFCVTVTSDSVIDCQPRVGHEGHTKDTGRTCV